MTHAGVNTTGQDHKAIGATPITFKVKNITASISIMRLK